MQNADIIFKQFNFAECSQERKVEKEAGGEEDLGGDLHGAPEDDQGEGGGR